MDRATPTDPTPGEWSIIPSPNTSNTEENGIFSVACGSPTQCWAVGRSYDGSVYHTLILQWDGTSWSIAPSPSTDPTQSNYLSEVACTSASQCWAVGWWYDGRANHTLILLWDGVSWAIVPSPDAGTRGSRLGGVACNSTSDCWAVGDQIDTNYQTLALHWDGVSWSIVPSPDTGSRAVNYLGDVTCSSASDCWAVGLGQGRTLAIHWDGVTWSIVHSPNHRHSTGANYLSDVACPSASDCWAIGGYYAYGIMGVVDHTLAEHWDGTSWSIIDSPDVGFRDNMLVGITCLSASQCWAVGRSTNTNNFLYNTLVEYWDGSSWSVVDSPNTDPNQSNSLYSVTCTSASQCWAVGEYYDGTIGQTLIEQFTPAQVQLTGAASELTHRSAGTFDIDMPLSGTPGVEDRSSSTYTAVFTFDGPVISGDVTVLSGTATVGPITFSGNEMRARLTGVADVQTVVLHTENINGDGLPDGDVSFSFLTGDVNGNGRVDQPDIDQVNADQGHVVDATNFRDDINLSGTVDRPDITAVRANRGHHLP
jgi:hypothetical protein